MTLPCGITIPVGELAALCRRYQVKELSVFGSAARGDLRPDSDIDLLVDFQSDARPSLLTHIAAEQELSALLERRVDLVSKRALRPLIRAEVLKDAKVIYAA
jgi:hypothetical protein